MRIAIPYWMGRISPVFDVSSSLLLVDIENSIEIGRDHQTLPDDGIVSRANHCEACGVEVLICGAISRVLEITLKARNIQVIPQTCGEVEEVIKAYLSGRLDQADFRMPGCKLHTPDFELYLDQKQQRTNIRRSGMRILITAKGTDLDSPIDPRFGRAEYFILFDTESGKYTALDNSHNLHADHGAGIRAAKKAIDEGANIVITGNIGPKAADALDIAKVQVFLGSSGTVEEVVHKFEAGSLKGNARPVGSVNKVGRQN